MRFEVFLYEAGSCGNSCVNVEVGVECFSDFEHSINTVTTVRTFFDFCIVPRMEYEQNNWQADISG